MTDTNATQALVAKILAAATASGYVQKGKDHAQGYKYADDEAITSKFRDAMIANGVLVFPEAMEFADIQVFPTEGKAPNVLTSIKGYLVATDGIASLKIASLGQGIDRGDKAIYKAMTGFKKYGYRHLVMMATGDDPEVARDDEKPAQTAPAKSEPKASADPNAKASEAARRKVMATATEKGVSKELLAKVREKVTGKPSSLQFTNADIDKMLEALNDQALLVAIQTGGELVPA